MRKRVFVTAALAALLVAGGLYASNMGFKLNYPLAGPTAGGGVGNNSLALPYNQQTNLIDAEDLLQDVNASVGSSIALSATRFLTDDTTETYTGAAGVNFLLTPGEGYSVKVGDPGGNYIVVGSHDPSLVINLLGPASGGGVGNNMWAYPYHSTATNAEDLISEVNAAAGSPVVLSVTRFLTDDSTETYTGSAGVNFACTPGEAYSIKVSADTSFVPSHY